MTAVCKIVDAARFEGLHTRFRSVIARVLELDEAFYPRRRAELAFVRRLLAAWHALNDPVHAANARTLWKVLSWFEAEVELAECELDCLEAELRPAGAIPPARLTVAGDGYCRSV